MRPPQVGRTQPEPDQGAPRRSSNRLEGQVLAPGKDRRSLKGQRPSAPRRDGMPLFGVANGDGVHHHARFAEPIERGRPGSRRPTSRGSRRAAPARRFQFASGRFGPGNHTPPPGQHGKRDHAETDARKYVGIVGLVDLELDTVAGQRRDFTGLPPPSRLFSCAGRGNCPPPRQACQQRGQAVGGQLWALAQATSVPSDKLPTVARGSRSEAGITRKEQN